MIYGKKDHFDAIHESIIPCVSGTTPKEKCMCFPEMSHLIENSYNKVRIDLTRYDFSGNFFPLRSGLPQNLTRHIICVGWLSESLHFVQVYLNLGCPTPHTSPEWITHSTTKVETWLNNFLDRMEELTKSSEIERDSNKQKSKAEPHIDIDLGGDTFF